MKFDNHLEDDQLELNSTEQGDLLKLDVHSNSLVNGIKSDFLSKNKEQNVNKDEKEPLRCSFLGYSPEFLQIFLTPKWVLFWLSCASALQGFIVNGLVNVMLSTIERRYQLKGTELGIIASGYDVASVFLLIPVSFFGGTRNKPHFIGIGMIVLSKFEIDGIK
jgi:organic anion transporter